MKMSKLVAYMNEQEKKYASLCFSHPLGNKSFLIRAFWSFVLTLLVVNCENSPVPQKESLFKAKIYHEGHINCFKRGTQLPNGKVLFCETSAVVFHNNRVILANDKPIPEDIGSAVFSLPFKDGVPQETMPKYFTAAPFLNARKLEGLTLTPDRRFIIATTAFDRLEEGFPGWDRYNSLLIWPVGDPKSVKIVSPSHRNGIESSRELREKILVALGNKKSSDKPSYFKVEGLAAVPGDKLLLGIRELGENYKSFKYVIKVVTVSYKIQNGEMILEDDFELAYDLEPSSLNLKYPGLNDDVVGLSSLEYDRENICLYLLTSIETESELGGYLWVVSLEDFFAKRDPSLVVNNRGEALKFFHKAEGISVIDENRVIVVYDDDRVVIDREPNQANYSLIEFTK